MPKHRPVRMSLSCFATKLIKKKKKFESSYFLLVISINVCTNETQPIANFVVKINHLTIEAEEEKQVTMNIFNEKALMENQDLGRLLNCHCQTCSNCSGMCCLPRSSRILFLLLGQNTFYIYISLVCSCPPFSEILIFSLAKFNNLQNCCKTEQKAHIG